MGDSDVCYESENDVPKKRCNWCNQQTKLAPNKPYCKTCESRLFRVCRRCKKPYPSEKYFEKNDLRCNSCQEKYLREKEKRQKKNAKKVDKDMTSSEDDTSEQKPQKADQKKIEDYSSPSKKLKPANDSNKIIIKKRNKKYLVIYETDNCSD